MLLAAPRGYCAGVDRAVATVELALARHGPPIYVRKEIVHNKHVVAGLRAKGAVFVDALDLAPPGAVVVFSAHGVSPAVRAEAAARGLKTIDATCPLVTKVHREARRLAQDGRTVLFIGHAGHEEVEGTMGQAPQAMRLVERAADADRVAVADPAKVAWLSQTTLSVDETAQIVARLRQRFPQLLDPPSDDICYATQNRQQAVKAISADCQLVVVVGSPNSSNSVRLLEVARESGAGRAERVDSAADIEDHWLDGVGTVGVTSGASVPEELVTQVLERLGAAGFARVEIRSVVEERLTFALPPEVRRLD
ncbi:MAG: 4-hydroxy-3-methylbut-2-enyl diphosphate reductase [Propionibacteriaceae bacterium]|nr:4-hydroxy-3-methylbut-2-enyl diphosphate reductase [Propionibacteriaceae bacterium]